MFDQTTAVLVALAACLASDLDAVALPTLFDKGLSIAGTPDAGLLSIAVALLISRDIL